MICDACQVCWKSCLRGMRNLRLPGFRLPVGTGRYEAQIGNWVGRNLGTRQGRAQAGVGARRKFETGGLQVRTGGLQVKSPQVTADAIHYKHGLRTRPLHTPCSSVPCTCFGQARTPCTPLPLHTPSSRTPCPCTPCLPAQAIDCRGQLAPEGPCQGVIPGASGKVQLVPATGATPQQHEQQGGGVRWEPAQGMKPGREFNIPAH